MANERQELERLRKLKRLNELESRVVLRPEQAATPVEQDFIPTDENLALPLPVRAKSSLLDEVKGVADAVLTLGTAGTTGALGYGLGAAEGIIGELTGRIPEGEGYKIAEKYASSLTRDPKTKIGREIVKDVGEALSVLPPTAPLNTNMLAGSRFISNKALSLLPNNPAKRKSALVQEILKGNPNIKTVAKTINEKGDIVTRPASKVAVKVLGGDDKAKGLVSVIETSNSRTKNKVSSMLDIIEKGQNEPLFRDANRTSDILGESILERAKAISRKNESASKDIGKITEALKNKRVDISKPANKFFDGLSNLGVILKEGEDGWLTPDFSRSKFNGGDAKSMTVLINDLKEGVQPFDVAHKLKRMIRDNVDYGKAEGKQVKGDSKRILKTLAAEINAELQNNSTAYKKANDVFSQTVELKDKFDKILGKDIDISSPKAAQVLGAKGRSLLTKNISRSAVQQMLDNTDKTLAGLNVRFKDSLPALIHISAELDDIFKLAPKEGFKGSIIGAGVDVLETATSPIGALKATGKGVASAVNKLTDPNFSKKMKALRGMLNENTTKEIKQ